MVHLICTKCGKTHELKEGQSEDLETCECGGELKYVQNYNMHIDDELDPINELNICPDCGKEILTTEKYCKSCRDKKNNLEKSE